MLTVIPTLHSGSTQCNTDAVTNACDNTFAKAKIATAATAATAAKAKVDPNQNVDPFADANANPFAEATLYASTLQPTPTPTLALQ